MTDGIRAVVATEAPVHLGVVYERSAPPGTSGGSGPVSRDNIDAAVGLADVIREGEFLTLADAPRPAVRTPVPACERTVDQVHDDELALALVSFVRDAGRHQPQRGHRQDRPSLRLGRARAGHQQPDGRAHRPAPPQRRPGRG